MWIMGDMADWIIDQGEISDAMGEVTSEPYPDKIEPNRILRQCPHCGHETDEYKFILIDGSLECPRCFTPIIERKEGEGETILHTPHKG
jgi:hypothetical protein